MTTNGSGSIGDAGRVRNVGEVVTTPDSTPELRERIRAIVASLFDDPPEFLDPVDWATAALEALIGEASKPCAECAIYHWFHASRPFDALSAEAP